jgi:hypothetical protein
MKTLFFTLATAVATMSFGQTFQAKTIGGGGGGFDVSTGTQTSDSLSVDGESFSIFVTESGSKYIKAVSSRTGEEYAVWVGEETEGEFQGRSVYESRSGAFCVYQLGSSGYPYSRWLEVVE